MSDGAILTVEEQAAAAAIMAEVERAPERLSEAERDEYAAAQRSVVNARRHAELHEGNLQIC